MGILKGLFAKLGRYCKDNEIKFEVVKTLDEVNNKKWFIFSIDGDINREHYNALCKMALGFYNVQVEYQEHVENVRNRIATGKFVKEDYIDEEEDD